MKLWEHATKTIQDCVPGFKPKLGIILGSGLNPVAEAIQQSRTIAFEEIEGFPNLSVSGHSGQLTLGYINGLPVACLEGRSHFYEGYSHVYDGYTVSGEKSFAQLMTPVRTLKLLGCEALLATNSSGSLRPEVQPGQIVAISDHINFQFTNPLVGSRDEEFGSRFIGMEDTYDPKLRKLIAQAAKKLNLSVTEGIYIGVLGPSFETPAEIRTFRSWGADVVGMSTISEVITARHCGLRVAVLSLITNMAAGMSQEKLSHEVTLKGAREGVTKLIDLIMQFVKLYAHGLTK